MKEVFNWQPDVKIGTTLGRQLVKLCLLREGGLTKVWYTSVMRFGKWVEVTVKSQGWRGVVIYCKACSTMMQQGLGNHVLSTSRLLGCAVSRTGRGLPRIIPSVHRKAIRSGDRWTFRLWLSLFGLYRVIEIPGKLKLNSITAPGLWSKDQLYEWSLFVRDFMPVLLKVVNPRLLSVWERGLIKLNKRSKESLESLKFLDDYPLDQTIKSHWIERVSSFVFPTSADRWFGFATSSVDSLLPITKSSPNTGKPENSGPGSKSPTSIGSVLTDLNVMDQTPEGWKIYGILTNLIGCLNRTTDGSDRLKFVQSIRDEARVVFKEIKDYADTHPDVDLEFEGYGVSYRKKGDPYYKPLPGFGMSRGIGYLGLKDEPSGKVRVFAMVDNLTQSILKPIHDVLFSILKKIPQDGTFDQMAPVSKLKAQGHKRLWSYDLSAATDRFSRDYQQVLIGALFSPTIARWWISALVLRPYRTPIRKSLGLDQAHELYYGAGQPMGALTSWAAFALTHHILVQYAAYKAYGKLEWFTKYALLGDDIVIADEKMVKFYEQLLASVGVEIGLHKSLISDNGTFEFAKKTFKGSDDFSPIPLKALSQAVLDPSVLESILEIGEIRGLRNALRTSARLYGYGFRSLARLPVVLRTKSRLQGLAILLSRPNSPWGLTPEEWFLQTEVGHQAALPESGYSVVKDAIEQRLLASLDKALENLRVFLESNGEFRQGYLLRWKNDMVPSYISDLELPKYRKFLNRYIVSSWLKRIGDELARLEELVQHTKDAIGPENALDHAYALVQDALAEITSNPTSTDAFLRPINVDRKEDPSKQMRQRLRSKAVRLWRSARGVLKGTII